MATVGEHELWMMAHDFYVRARASVDPSTKRKRMRAADDYFKQANELRRSHVIQAVYETQFTKDVAPSRETPPGLRPQPKASLVLWGDCFGHSALS
jgi:hypothetical protein